MTRSSCLSTFPAPWTLFSPALKALSDIGFPSSKSARRGMLNGRDDESSYRNRSKSIQDWLYGTLVSGPGDVEGRHVGLRTVNQDWMGLYPPAVDVIVKSCLAGTVSKWHKVMLFGSH
jgi:hypothetical protein